MASDLEDDEDLASLRSAALASLNVRSTQASPLIDTNHQENIKQDDEEDEDENLEALRLAALKTKKAVVPQPVTPQPRGPSPIPSSEAPINAVRGNNLISIPLVDLSSQDTSSNGPVVPEVKKEVRNDKFSRFQSDSESEEEEEVESEPEYNRPESSADDADASDISDDESVSQSCKNEESDNSSGENDDGSASSSESESDTEKSSETESSTSSSESDEDSSSEGSQSDEESTKEIIEKKKVSEAKNGTVKLQTEKIKLKSIDPPGVVNKTGIIDLRNQLRKKHSETGIDRVEHKDRFKTDHITDHISSRSHSRSSYRQQNTISRREPGKYRSNRDRKGNNVDRGHKHRHNYDRPPRKSEEVRKKDNYSSDNKREKDRRSALSSADRNKILDRRKSDKQKEKSHTKKPDNDSLKKYEKLLEEKCLTTSEHLSLSDSESDIDTDSRFKQAKIDRAGDQIDTAPSRIVTSMQFNKNIESNFGRKRDFHRDRRKDQDLRYGPRFDRKLESRRNDQYHKKDEKSYQKKHDLRENYASSRRERGHGRDPVRSRELEFVDDSDEDMDKKGIRSLVHTNNTKNNRIDDGPIEKRYKDSEPRRKDSKKGGKKPSSKERTECSRTKENRTGKKKAESSVKLLKKVKHLDVGDTSKTTEVSVTFDSDPAKVLKKSKKSIQERLGKTVPKQKAPVKLRLGPKDVQKSETWHGLENLSKGSENSAQQDARKFVSKDAGKSRKSVKERLNLKRTHNDIALDSTVEPSRKIVRSSAVDKLSEEEKLKRKKREREIQEKIRKIEERNLAWSKEQAKNNDIDLPSKGHNKDKALELRIRRIKEKNEAILKRQREIEEDKQKYGK